MQITICMYQIIFFYQDIFLLNFQNLQIFLKIFPGGGGWASPPPLIAMPLNNKMLYTLCDFPTFNMTILQSGSLEAMIWPPFCKVIVVWGYLPFCTPIYPKEYLCQIWNESTQRFRRKIGTRIHMVTACIKQCLKQFQPFWKKNNSYSNSNFFFFNYEKNIKTKYEDISV